MRILVVSDTHGYIDELIKYIKDRNLKFDLMIHLGDYVEDGDLISEKLELPSYIVAGNGDFYSDYPNEEIITIENKKIFLTHGHINGISYKFDSLVYKAMELGVDIALFGHTHVPIKTIEREILFLNPGSPTYPRNINKEKTFAIMDIKKEDIRSEIVKIN